MQTSIHPYHPLSVTLAEALLGAWVLGDARRVTVELDRSRFLDPAIHQGQEAERVQLIKAIAQRMGACPDLFAAPSTDPTLDLCVDLLAHLAATSDLPD